MNQHRFLRLLKLIEMMKTKPRPIYAMSKYLNISERSVYRYIDCFKESGLQVYKDKHNKYGIQ